MNRVLSLSVPVFALFLISIQSAFAVPGCERTINLQVASPSARGGTVVYKGNVDSNGNDLPFSAGNHSQAGPAILMTPASGFTPSSAIAMDLNGKTIATGFSRPRCTKLGCGAYNRFYFGFGSARGLKAKSTGGSILIKLKGACFRVSNVYSRREQY